MKMVSAKFPEKLVNGLDQLVREGLYTSRSDAIRVAVRDLLLKELPEAMSANRTRSVQEGGGSEV